MWREFKGIKQLEVAKQIGKSKSTLSKIETGLEPPNTQLLEDIADAMDLPVIQLYTSPQQHFTFNNCPNCNGINNGTQNVHNIDKDFTERIINLIDKFFIKLSA